MHPIGEIVLDWSSGLIIYGPLGIICLWFMWRDDQRDKLLKEMSTTSNAEIRGLSHRISGLSKALMLDVVAREGVGERTRKIAEDMLARAPNGVDMHDD